MLIAFKVGGTRSQVEDREPAESMNNDSLQADKINPNIHTPMYIHQVFSMATLTTRIFKNGNSQAVRIPQEFRLDVTQVEISRNNTGDLVIHPLPVNRGKALLAALEAFDTDFINQLEQNYQQQPIMQERESL